MKPVIEDVIIPEKELAELNRILSSSSYRHTKTEAMRKIAGGKCCICYGVPSKKVSYDLDGEGTRLEYYCIKCFERWTNEERVKLRATNGLDETIVRRM